MAKQLHCQTPDPKPDPKPDPTLSGQDLTRDVFQAIQAAIPETVKRTVEQYGSPLQKMIERSLLDHDVELKSIVNQAVQQAVTGDFSAMIQQALSHKLTKTLIQKCEGEIEKRANDLRSDPAFRARLTLAIEQAVGEIRRPV